MSVDVELIERIYEAAALPERWPNVLQAVAQSVQAFGVCFVHRTNNSADVVLSAGMEEFAAAYFAGGWLTRDDRVPPVITDHYPGFRIDPDYWTEEQARATPIYRDFLLPRGMKASAGCYLQGARDDAVHIGIEGLPSYEESETIRPVLDLMRPHLARAFSLSARLREARAADAVTTLQLAGIGAAVVSGDGRPRAVNERFAHRIGGNMSDGRLGLRFADRFLQAQFAEALAALSGGAAARSIGVATRDELPAFAIHLLPLRRGTRDIFGWDGVLLLLAEPANASVPGADLLRLLFDLTPAEALLTRRLLEGRTLAAATKTLRITEATARTHLRSVFAKTGVNRQPELVRLLMGLGPPTD